MVELNHSRENLEFYPKSPPRSRVGGPFFHPLMRQLILDLLPENPPSLDNFVPGDNAEALAALAVWRAAGNRETSLLLYGGTGSGKTHLLRASSTAYHDAATTPDLDGLADIPSDGEIPLQFAVDNVEALSPTGQIVLFNLFNRLRAAGRRLLTSASQPPLGLPLREDLRTRLGSGLVYRLVPLSDGEQRAALAAQAEARALPLPSGALDYLLTHTTRDMRHLSALLTALDRYSLERQRPITMPLLREVLHCASSPASR